MRFPHFQDEWLRDLPNEIWVPKRLQGRPFNIFETGGTTGMPKQRIRWEDYKGDYSEFSEKLSDAHFPRGHYWRIRCNRPDRKSTRLNSSHTVISYAVFCFKKKSSQHADDNSPAERRLLE